MYNIRLKELLWRKILVLIVHKFGDIVKGLRSNIDMNDSLYLLSIQCVS